MLGAFARRAESLITQVVRTANHAALIAAIAWIPLISPFISF